MAYRIFKRKNWRKEGRGYVPWGHPGRTYETVETLEEAQRVCREANAKCPRKGTAGYYNFVWTEFTETDA